YFYDSAYESGYTAGTTTTDTTGPKEASFDGQKAYFVGKDPANPEVGDVRVTYEIVRPGTVSIIAKQSDDSFKPYKTKAGKTIEMLSIGDQDAEQMFDAAISGNKALTWGLRVFCFILMLIAVNMIFKPLSVLADPIPLLGDIAQFGIGLISFVIALALTLVAVAIAWFVYRPVLSIVLIALAVAAVYGMKQMKAGKSAVVRPTPKA
ncbi:MAG TPA: TMEM43 family protein, partial [bacterium]|nr:TMEM43 family protein [bacterium]